MIEIDGSFGEGGGQILRTSLSLSLVTGKPFHIKKIRMGRDRPGMLRQHLAAALAAAEVGNASMEGAFLGSSSLTFSPTTIKPGKYHFSVGTAGSGTLVLQTVLPALVTANAPSELVIEGGTHNMAAPPFDFLAKSFLPLVEKMGPKVHVQLDRFGFYPAGGGQFVVNIEPCTDLRPLHLGERGHTSTPKVNAIVANLPRNIAQREIDTVSELLNLGMEQTSITETKNSPGPGNIVSVEVESAEVLQVFTAFGKLGVTAEKVGADVAAQARDYLASEANLCEHLADQLLMPLALAGSGSFTTVSVSSHAQTNMDVISRFLPVTFSIEQIKKLVRIEIRTAE